VVKKALPIRWSRRTLEEFVEGLGFIARHNPVAAGELRDEILQALDQVRDFPRVARMVPEEGDPSIREILRQPFRIILEIRPSELRILSVRRMERDPLTREDLT